MAALLHFPSPWSGWEMALYLWDWMLRWGKGNRRGAPEVNLTLTRDEVNAHSSAPRTGFTWPGTQKLHRSKMLGVSLRWSFNVWFSAARMSSFFTLYTQRDTHTRRRGYRRKSALWSSANPSRFNTDAYSWHCLPVIEYCILWVLVKLLLKFAGIKIVFSTLHFEIGIA